LAAVEAPALNKNKSAASFCCQVAAWIPDMFCDFYLVKNQKIVTNDSTTPEAIDINSAHLESFEF
jgi:hypothetical protein